MSDLLKHSREHYAVYTIEDATLRLCGVSEENLSKEVRLIRFTGNRVPSSHPKHKDFKLCNDIINEALRTGQLPYEIGEKRHFVSLDNRNIARAVFNDWIAKSGPSDLPESLFSKAEEKTNLIIIGALIGIGTIYKNAPFSSQYDLISSILGYYEDPPYGLGKRTLEKRFAMANRSTEKSNNLIIIKRLKDIRLGVFKDETLLTPEDLINFIHEMDGISQFEIKETFDLATKAINGRLD